MEKSIEEIYNKLKNTDETVLNYTVELSKEMYERELDRSKWSDDKTSMLLSVIGIIGGLLFLGSKEYSEISMNQYHFVLSMTIFSGIFLLVSMIFLVLEAVQQFKIGRKRKENRALNTKRSEIFGAKTNCGTASLSLKTRPLNFIGDSDILYIHASTNDIDIKRYVASLYLNAYHKNLEVINDKVTDRNIATFFMLPAILVIFSLTLFIMIA